MPHTLSDHTYGKRQVRLSKVCRHADQHAYVELSVDIQLRGGFAAAYTEADNRCVIPTDTMKNIVYVLAHQNDFASSEPFGQILAEYFLGKYDQVDGVRIHLTERPWTRVEVSGTPHPHSFCGSPTERFTSIVTGNREGDVTVTSGLEGLPVLKTTDSSFSGFVQDEHTTLAEADDRIFATVINAQWDYQVEDPDWLACRNDVRQVLLETFAAHVSQSAQQTLYAMANAVLDACEAIKRIRIQLPNQHRVLVDLEPFSIANSNEIFVPIEAPHGQIEATVERGPPLRRAP